jgi:hypothetical protein
VEVRCVAGSEWAGFDDEALLRLAAREGFVLVTYDIADYAPLIPLLRQSGEPAPGVIFVSGRRYPTSAHRRLAGALAGFAARIHRGHVDPSCGVFLGASGS